MEDYKERFSSIDDLSSVVSELCKSNDLDAIKFVYDKYKTEDLLFDIITKAIATQNYNILKYFIENYHEFTEDDYGCFYSYAYCHGTDEMIEYLSQFIQ